MNANIYIITHTDFACPVHNPVYKIVTCRDLNENYDLEVLKADGLDLPESDPFYAELYHYKYLADNVKLPKYVGFCHYRKYWLFADNVPDMDELFKTYDLICPRPMQLGRSMRQQYANCHNVEDLDLAAEILKEMYPVYKTEADACLSSQTLYPCNMFVMKSKDFKAYVKWMYSILDEFCKRRGDMKKYIHEHYSDYEKPFREIKDMEKYQYRVGGYVAERLTNIYFLKNFHKKYAVPVIMTGDRKEVYRPDSIDVGLVHYNTPDLLNALIKSIRKNNKVRTHVHVLDNSDKLPFTTDDPDVTVYDNTKQQLISFDTILANHPKGKRSSGTQNNYASLKHCMSVEALMGFIGKPFVLLDSDTLVKRDLSELFDQSIAVAAEFEPSTSKFWRPRFIPFCMYLNTPMLIANDVHFFDEKRCCGLFARTTHEDGYDTAASLWEDVQSKALKYKYIKWSDYVEHYFNASWKPKANKSPQLWLSEHQDLYL